MTDSSNRPDSALRDRFHRERQREAASTPSFERILAPRKIRHPGVRRWVALGFAGAAAITIAAVALTRRSEPSEAARRLVAVRLGEWRTPTDFLLDVAGAEFLREVPTFGRAEGWFPLVKSGSPRL